MRASLVVAFLLSVITAASAYGEAQYWLSVASYQSEREAQEGQRKAESLLTDSFSIVGTNTDKGYYYRVVAGPYLSREAVLDRVSSAQASGYVDAWVWVRKVDSLSGAYDRSAYDIDYDAAYEPEENSPYVPAYEREYESIELDLGGERISPDKAPARQNDNPPPKLVDEAPPGYKLNKMRRDAQLAPLARPPPIAETVDPPSLPVVSLNAGNPITLPSYKESQIDISIDGRLDEAVWHEFPGVDSFRVVDPDTGSLPRHETLVKMFYTERGLYASFKSKQPSDTLVRRYSSRDDRRLNRDTVGITLDTSGEGLYGYWLNLALGNNQIDGTVLPERQFSSDWDGAWYGGTQTTDEGWDAEIFLPWSQVAMPKQAGERRVNAYASRKVAYINERWAVPTLPFTQPLFMSALQPLVLDHVDPQQQWSLFPFVALTQDEVEGFTDTKVGTDIFWRPSTNLQLTATLNPDFGNVESDEVIVNLGAFETFFPEKRLFFQEGVEIFKTTPRDDGSNPTTVLNTRRIGGQAREPTVPDDVTVPARELGQPSELIGAVKAVGQFGKVRYGLLAAAEDEIKFDVDEINFYQEGSDYGVVRFLYENKAPDGTYRAIGTISTLAAHPEEDAEVHGIDYHYFTGSGKWTIDGQFLQSNLDLTGVGKGGFIDVGYTVRQGMNFKWGLSHFDDKFDINDLGFNRRNDATNMRLNMDYQRSNISWLRKLRANSFLEWELNGDGDQTRKGFGTRIEFGLLNQDRINLGVAHFPERDEDRSSRDNGTFVVEARQALSVDYFTDTAERLSYRFGIGHDGEEVGGSRYRATLGVIWRPLPVINIAATAEFQERNGWLLWQEDRNFTTFDAREWRPRLNFDYFLSAKQQLRFSAQWVGIKAKERSFFVVPDRVGELQEVERPAGDTDDFAISRLNLQLRYRWEIAPLSELSVVYTLNGSESSTSGGFEELARDALDDPVGEQLILKLRYRLGS